MKRNPRLILLVAFAIAPFSQAQGLGFSPMMLFVGRGALESRAEPERVDRAGFHKSAGFVISTFDRKVIDEFGEAWMRVGNGTSSYESVVLILRMADGGYGARLLGWTNQHRAFTFGWHPATVAIVHTHPNNADPRPQGDDLNIADKYGVPIFTIGRHGMFVYDPATKTTTKVKDGLDWLDPSKWPEKFVAKH
ncbi:MAG TPA: hypothetical protein VNS63_09695 [Blastocatellia bacterium]|nr:hypothetical protein [Blastocatellia bacterium]